MSLIPIAPLIRIRPMLTLSGLPIYVAAAQLVPFTTSRY